MLSGRSEEAPPPQGFTCDYCAAPRGGDSEGAAEPLLSASSETAVDKVPAPSTGCAQRGRTRAGAGGTGAPGAAALSGASSLRGAMTQHRAQRDVSRSLPPRLSSCQTFWLVGKR